jgi:phage N-6-adenine-methyltransferase
MKRHQSRQDYATPWEFMDPVVKRFGEISCDLAAHAKNKKCDRFFSPKEDSFSQHWHKIPGILWLNPPFNDITPWARKCAAESDKGAQILFLTPASIGSCWFADYVFSKALVIGLTGRISFDGKAPYPKDCMLSCYGFGAGFEVWDWMADTEGKGKE